MRGPDGRRGTEIVGDSRVERKKGEAQLSFFLPVPFVEPPLALRPREWVSGVHSAQQAASFLYPGGKRHLAVAQSAHALSAPPHPAPEHLGIATYLLGVEVDRPPGSTAHRPFWQQDARLIVVLTEHSVGAECAFSIHVQGLLRSSGGLLVRLAEQTIAECSDWDLPADSDD